MYSQTIMSVNTDSPNSTNAILSTFSLTLNNNWEENRFEKLASLKKLLRQELNKSITIDECDAVLLAGALLLNDIDTVKEQSRLINDINIRLWGNATDPLSKWIQQYNILPQVKNMNKFIEGNTPLHFAVLTGNFENIAFLLSKQADPFLKNAHGDKPLELCQDYHRKLHAKTDKKRRHKSLKKKRCKKKSHTHKRSKSCNHKPKNNNNKPERSHSYDNDADDENESDFFYNNSNSNDSNSNDESSISSTITIENESQSPMHLSCTEFDQLFSNAVKNMDKKLSKNMKKNTNSNIKLNAKLRDKRNCNKNKSNKNTNKSKLKCKSIRKCKSKTSKHNRNNHGKNNRNKHNKRRPKHNTHKKHNNRKNINNKMKNNMPNKTVTQSLNQLHNQPPVIKMNKSDSISISSSSSCDNCSNTSTSSTDESITDTISSISSISSISAGSNTNTSSDSSSDSSDSSISTSVTLSSSDSSDNTSSSDNIENTNSVEINIDRKNGKIIAKSLTVTKNFTHMAVVSSDDNYTETSESSYDEIHITSDECDESSSIISGSDDPGTISSGCSSVSGSDISSGDDKGDAINKLLQETMEQQSELKEKEGIICRNGEVHDNENDLHSQLVPIIIALSEINIFAESASLARIVKFICTLIFFVALHWLEGNSAAKMIVKVGVSIIYLAAMFGHRINEWKECIDAETVLRKQQWTKQRDKERQKRKDKLQKTLRSPDSKRCVAKKQRKLERDMFYKQAEYDWRSRIRMMINHAESAFIQHKWEMAEIYFSRLLGFLMENETDAHVFLNRKNNLKIHKRWKGVFNNYYSIPIAKMFSRRAYCLCKIKAGEYPHGAPANNVLYKTVGGHIELAIGDLKMALQLREMSPIYQKFMKLYKVQDNNGNVNINDAKYICDEKLDILVMIMGGQISDLVSLGGLYDLKDEFDNAYENTLQADDIIHCLNKFNKQYIHIKEGEISKKHMKYMCLFTGGNFKLILDDIVPLKDVDILLQKKDKKCGKSVKDLCNIEEVKHNDCRSKSMISLLQISHSTGESKLYSVDIDDGKIMNYNKLELMDDKQLDRLLAYPLRRKVDLNGYKLLIGKDKCSMKVQNIIDEQLKIIRLLRLQAANRQRAVNLKNEREKMKYNKSSNVFSMLSSLDNDKKKQKKKDKSKSKNQKEKIKTKDKIDKIEKPIHEKVIIKDKPNKPITKHPKNNDNKSIKKPVVKCVESINDKIMDKITTEDEVKMQVKEDKKDIKKIDTEISELKLLKIKNNPSTPNSTISAETNNSITLSMCSDTTSSNTNNTNTESTSLSNNIASTIMEYSNSFSVIKSDKEHDDNDCEETKMSMIKNNNNNNAIMDNISNSSSSKSISIKSPRSNTSSNKNKNKFGKKKPQRRSQIKLKKLKRKNKNKIAKKKTKKNQSKANANAKLSDNTYNNNNVSKSKKCSKQLDDNDERLSISSEISKSESFTTINNDVDNDDDSLSISTSTSSDSIKHKSKKNNKNISKKYKRSNYIQSSTRNRNIPPRQQKDKRSPKDNYNNKHYRDRKKNNMKINTENNNNNNNNNGDEPREHWLWNVNCDFWPNCRNSDQCPFKHPTDEGSVVRRRRTTPKSGDIIGKPIMCKFGGNCSRIDCWFWHPGDDETFIHPSSIPTSPQLSQDKTNDEPVLLRDRSLSTHSDPSIITHSENSYEIIDENIEDIVSNIPINIPVTQPISVVPASNSNSAVIITKKTRANPWQKVSKNSSNNSNVISNSKPTVSGSSSGGGSNSVSGSIDAPNTLLSPTTFNNKQILSGHTHNSNLNIRANVNVNPPPLTTTITVGAIYHNEFNINDYNITDMIRPPKTNRKCKTPTAAFLNNNRKHQHSMKIKSNLNPNASEFSSSRNNNKHRKIGPRPPSAPIRPPMRNNSHYFDANKPKSVDIPTPASAPFDPHSQLQNGGVFTPHSAYSDSKSSNNISSSTHSHHTSPASIFGGGLGTHIGSPNNNNYYSSGWSNAAKSGSTNTNTNTNTNTKYNRVSIDEYKQAPNFNNNNTNNSNNNWNYNNEYGDESKVVENTNINTINNKQKDNKISPATHPWICPSCSFLNEIGTTACELCSSMRPNKENEKDNNNNGIEIEEERQSKEQTPIDIINFNIKDIMNDKIENNNNNMSELHRNLSFNSLFFGNSNNNNNNNANKNNIEINRRNMITFNEGDHILYNKQNISGDIQSYEGIIIEIRDSTETPWPIKIKYDIINQSNNQKQIQTLWVLQEELTKITNQSQLKLESDDDDYYHVQKYDVEGFVDYHHM